MTDKIHHHATAEYVIEVAPKTARHKAERYTVSERGHILAGETVEQAAERIFRSYREALPDRIVTIYATVKQFVPGHGLNVYLKDSEKTD